MNDAAARRHAERRVEMLSAFARGIICEFDSECRYRDVWATDERLLAMPAEALIGRTIAEAVGEEVGQGLMEGTARVFATGIAETHEYDLSLEVGVRTFEAKIVRVRYDTELEPWRAVALIRDVTEERAVERKLAEAERLAGLGLLAAGIGHEINNPLMVIQEIARLAIARLGAGLEAVEPLKAMMGDVLDSAQRMQAMVSDLRLFRREDDDQRAPVDAHAVLGTALDITRRQIEQRAQLALDLQPVPLIAGSAAKLCQVFTNLLMNAVQAIEDGAPTAHEVRAHSFTDERGWAVVEISDTGRGIPAHELQRIFDPFYTTKREGMGLGLSICARIMTAWGGTITADSKVGEGTTFRVALPPTAAVARAVAAREPPVRAAPPRMRLLIIDDELVLRRVLEMSLAADHDVVATGSCEAALSILQGDSRFDAVLCDLMMPFGDGMHFYERLAQVAPELRSRVVFMTGGAFTDRARRFLEALPNETLEKPFGPQALARVLTQLGA